MSIWFAVTLTILASRKPRTSIRSWSCYNIQNQGSEFGFSLELHVLNQKVLGHLKPADEGAKFDDTVFLADFSRQREQVRDDHVLFQLEDLGSGRQDVLLSLAPQSGLFPERPPQTGGIALGEAGRNAIDGNDVSVIGQGRWRGFMRLQLRGADRQSALPAHQQSNSGSG